MQAVSFPFESSAFFFDLLSLSVIMLPWYHLLRSERARRLLMIAGGIYLTSLIAPRLIVFYIAFWSVVFFIHRAAFSEAKTNFRKYLAIAGMVSLLAVIFPMITWKIIGEEFVSYFTDWSNRVLQHVSTKLWEIDMVRPILAPVGLSFATFRAVDLLIKTYLGKFANLTYDQVLFYGFFPPVQVIGPVIEYEEVEKQDRRVSAAEFTDGLLRTAIGAVKVFLLAGLLQSTEQILTAPQDYPVWALWLKLVGYSWYFYLNFSGYSDMAIGISALYGYKLKENFNFPYFRRNVQEYWANWHMGLTRWVQRNIFVPAGGYRTQTQYRALFLTMMAIALWHNINASMFVFGLYHFAAQVIYRRHAAARQAVAGMTAPAQPLPYWRQAGYIALTYLTVLVGFPLLSIDLDKAVHFYAALAGFR